MSRTAVKTEGGAYRPSYPSAEDVLENILNDKSGGWEDLLKRPGAEQFAAARATANEDLRRCYAQVYATDAGRKVIEDLLNQTLRRSPYNTDPAATLEQQTVFGLIRQGQTSLMVHILAMIADGQELPPPGAEKTKTGKKRK